MIDKLTKKQEQAIVPYREFWKKRILRTEKTDEEIIKGVENLYKMAGFKKPKVYLMDSPLGSQIFANFLKNSTTDATDNISDDIEINIRSNIREDIESNIVSNIWSNIRDNIENNIRDKSLEYFVFSSNDASWMHWYIYQKFYFENGLLKKDKYSRELYKYIDNIVDTWMCLYFDGVAIVSRKPKIYINNNEFLHSDTLPAVQFNDGYELFFLNGVHFDKTLWSKIVNKKLSIKEFLDIKDVDQRTQALKYMSPEFIIEQAHGVLLDEYNKYDIHGEQVNYKLYKLPAGEIFREDAYYCLFDCPSTRERHFEGVEKSNTVAEAMAWAESDEELGLIVTPEMWISAIPLKHEN